MAGFRIQIQRRFFLVLFAVSAIWTMGCSQPPEMNYGLPSSGAHETVDPYSAYINCVKELARYNQSHKCDAVGAQSSQGMSFNQYFYGARNASPSQQGYQEAQLRAAWQDYLNRLNQEALAEMVAQWDYMAYQDYYNSYYSQYPY